MIEIRRSIVSLEVYEAIKEALLNGEWQAGQRIDRKSLAERFGISQTPVNDALNRLAGEGLLESRSHTGFFVPVYDRHALADIFAARAGFESIAARLCAEEADLAVRLSLRPIFEPFWKKSAPGQEAAYLAADKRFHNRILEISGSSRLREVEAIFGLASHSYESGLVRPPAETLPEHRRIIEAIEAGDGPAAQLGMAEHLLTSRRHLLSVQDGSPLSG